MSGVAVVNYVLAHDSQLIAVVPAARIFSGDAPMNTALPLITVKQIVGVPHLTVAMTESGRIQEDHVQASVLAKTYASQVAIMRLMRAALRNRTGTLNGVKVDSILPEGEGPDLYDDAAVVYQGSHDALVKWHLP